jgi:hypothetical protein
VKNESRFSTAKGMSFYSEFNADSEYVILFQKYCGQKKWPYRNLFFGVKYDSIERQRGERPLSRGVLLLQLPDKKEF